MFAEFDELAKGREAVDKLKGAIATGVYSINAPTRSGGCRIAIQVEGTSLDQATVIITELGGKIGSVPTPRRTAKQSAEHATENEAADSAAEGDTDVATKKAAKKSSKKAAAKKTPSPRFGKKTACAAPGHGEYGDIDAHNAKHHNGKAYVAPKEK